MSKCIFSLSADPIHFGHINTIERAARLFDQVHVAIGVNETKKYLFQLYERLDLIRRATAHIKNVEVSAFDGLLVDYAVLNGINIIIKSVRNAEDAEYERRLCSVGNTQASGIETLILFSDPRYENVSSSVIKALEQHKGFIHEFVPLCVKQALEKRLSMQVIIGVTGGIGCGKSYITKQLREHIPLRTVNIDFDNLVHEIYTQRSQPYYTQIRRNIIDEFGDDIIIHTNPEKYLIDSRILAGKVFPNPEKMNKLYKLLDEALFMIYRETLQKNKDCIIFLNCTYLMGNNISDFNLSYLCNNNIILVECDKKYQVRRLKENRLLTDQQIDDRLSSQYSNEVLKEKIERQIEKDGYGNLMCFNNSEHKPDSIKVLAENIKRYWWW